MDSSPPLRQIDPFDASKAHLGGLLISLVVAIVVGRSLTPYVPDAFFTVLAASVIASKRRMPFSEAFSAKPVPISILAFPAALAFAVKSAETLALEAVDFATRGGVARLAELFPGPGQGELRAAEMLGACLLAPVAEELFFRGFWQNSLKNLGYGWAIILPSLLFAVFHNPVAAPGAFAMGVLGGVLTARYGSIAPAVVFHATSNFAVLMIAWISKRYQGLVGEVTYWSVCAIGVLLAFRIRPELSKMWADSKLAWRDFRSRPAAPERFKSLFRHWTYIVIAVEVCLTVLYVVWTLATGKPVTPK